MSAPVLRYDPLRGESFTPCPHCRAARQQLGAMVVCITCKASEPISANNGRADIVGALKPIGQESY